MNTNKEKENTNDDSVVWFNKSIKKHIDQVIKRNEVSVPDTADKYYGLKGLSVKEILAWQKSVDTTIGYIDKMIEKYFDELEHPKKNQKKSYKRELKKLGDDRYYLCQLKGIGDVAMRETLNKAAKGYSSVRNLNGGEVYFAADSSDIRTKVVRGTVYGHTL